MGTTEPPVTEPAPQDTSTSTDDVIALPPEPAEPEAELDPRDVAAKAASGGDEGREMLEHVAMGAELDEREEKSALDWLLGDPVAIPHEIPVDFETPAGMRKLKFIVRKSDPAKIDEIEQRHLVNGRMDSGAADLEIVARLCDAVADETGREVEITSSQFRTMRVRKPDGSIEAHEFATPMDALNARLRGQQGLLMGIAREVRRLAGYDPTRVGMAQRRLVEASLG